VTGTLAVVFENPLAIDRQPSSICDPPAGLPGSGLAYLALPPPAAWGSTRSSLVAYLLPVVGIVLGPSSSARLSPGGDPGTVSSSPGSPPRTAGGTAAAFGGGDEATPAATTPAAAAPAATPTEAVAD
jgi:hypothetical protein